MTRRPLAALIAGTLILSLANPVHAGRGGGKGGPSKATSASISLDQTNPGHGDNITFTVATTETDRPFSKVDCYQGGTRVYSLTHGHFDQYREMFGEPVYTLSSLSWNSGAADCTAELGYSARNGRWRTLATVDFDVTA